MKMMRKQGRYVQFIVGFMCFGLGQRFIGKGLINPWSQDVPPSLVLGSLGILLFLLGCFFLTKLFSWFIKTYNQNNRVLKVIAIGLTLSLTLGMVIGLIGQWLYDYTPITYDKAKLGVWSLSSICQLLIKLGVLYYLSCYYKGRKPSLKDRQLWLLSLLALVLMVGACVATVYLTILGDVLLTVTDTIIIVAFVHYLVIRHQRL